MDVAQAKRFNSKKIKVGERMMERKRWEIKGN